MSTRSPDALKRRERHFTTQLEKRGYRLERKAGRFFITNGNRLREPISVAGWSGLMKWCNENGVPLLSSRCPCCLDQEVQGVVPAQLAFLPDGWKLEGFEPSPSVRSCRPASVSEAVNEGLDLLPVGIMERAAGHLLTASSAEGLHRDVHQAAGLLCVACPVCQGQPLEDSIKLLRGALNGRD